MYFIEPYLWTTNYFVVHRYTLTWFIFNVLVYGFIFDSWFYWTHRALHESQYLWDKIHTTHHGFKNPSAFCQDAVHPLEGLVQGMMNDFFFFHKNINVSLKRSNGSLFDGISHACSSNCSSIFRFVYFLLCE